MVPFLMAMTSNWWYHRLQWVRRITQGARLWDEEIVEPPDDPISLKRLRNFQNHGDKTVVCHYIAKLVKEYPINLRNTVFVATSIALVVVVFISLVNSASTEQQSRSSMPNATVLANQQEGQKNELVTQSGTSSNLAASPTRQEAEAVSDAGGVLLRALVLLGAPLGFLLLIVRGIVEFAWLHSQACKFRHLEDDAVLLKSSTTASKT